MMALSITDPRFLELLRNGLPSKMRRSFCFGMHTRQEARISCSFAPSTLSDTCSQTHPRKWTRLSTADPELPLRGVVDDQLIQRALAFIP